MTADAQTPITTANEHNMGSVEEPHYVVDVEVCQKLERELAAVRGQLEEANKRAHEVKTQTTEVVRGLHRAAKEAESALAGAKAEVEALREDAAIGKLVREKLIIGNCISVERCFITGDEVAAIDAAKERGC